MILANEFTVAAPLPGIWETLLDVERVAGCLPGATVEPVGEDGCYRGTLKLKVGPVTMAYDGTVRLQDTDDSSRIVSYDAAAREHSGSGTAAALITARLTPSGEGTHVAVETELNVTGRAAQFGRGMMEDVAGTMLDRFATSLRQLLAEPPSALSAAGAGAERPDRGPSPRPTDPLRGDRGSGAPASENVLDLTPSLRSIVSGRPAALVALVAAGALVLAVRQRRRRGVELTLTLRLR